MTANKKSEKKKWVIIGISAIVLILLIAFINRPKNSNYSSATAVLGDITTYYTFTGNVEAKDRQSVISGKVMQISKIYVANGDKVSEGDDLLRTTMGEYITADIDGEIVNLNVEVNQQVMSGIKLLDVVDYSAMQISVKVDEYDVSAVTVGKAATVKISALNKELSGTVSSISKEGTITNGVTYFDAVIDLAGDDSIKVGMSTEVKLVHQSATGVVLLPMSAIQFDSANKPYVLKKDTNGKIIKTDITVGINDGVNVEIASGVAEGDVVYYTSSASSTNMQFGRAVR